MRVLWVGHNLAYPPVRGVLQRNHNLLREAAKSCEVHVLAFDQPATRPPGVTSEDCVRALKQFCASVDWLPLSEGIVVGSRYWLALRGLASRDPFDVHRLRSNEMIEKLKKAIGRVPFNVVHFDTLGLAPYKSVVKKLGTVLNHHNIESSMMARRADNDGNILRRQYWEIETRKLIDAERQWCPQFAVNVVVSGNDAEVLNDSVPGIETIVVGNGVDTDYFTPRPDPGGKTLLFCGGLDWYPNTSAVDFFFNAIWPKLTRTMPDVEIYIVGRRPPKWLRRLSRRDGRVHVTGFVDDVRPYFRKATAYVCPVTDGGGTRLKILDALAMGVPLIGTSFACSGLSLKNEKHVLLAETPGDFVYQIERLLSSETLRASVAISGREIVARLYSWSAIGPILIRAYQRASAG